MRATSTNLTNTSYTTDPITTRLREKYQGSNYLTRFMSDEQYQLTDSYINLVIVKQEDSKDKEKKLTENQAQTQEQGKNKEFIDERLATYESLHDTGKPIEIKDIFDNKGSQDSSSSSSNNKEIKKVLVYGRAGIGKSTLCKYLAVKWQEGSLWSDKFKAVIWLPLRELLDTEGKNSVKLEEVIKDKCIDGLNKPSKEEIKNYLNENRDNLLFILDGYDEIAQVIDSPKYMGLRRLLKDLIKDHNLSVILTSRPMSIKLGLEIIATFDKQLENIGFTNENIKQYVQKFYPENSQKLIKFLEQNKSIWGIAHIPINLDLICSIWEPYETNQETEYTMSSLYIQINKRLLERYLQKFQGVNLDKLTPQEYEEKTKDIIAGLEQLAMHGMLSNQIMIPSLEVSKVPSEVLKSGLVKTTGNKKYEKDKDIYFLHLTFQEFYAANYIAKSLENIGSKEYKEAKALISEHKYNPYYQVMWWFTVGILYERGKGKEKDNYLGLIHLFNQIENYPRTLTGFSHVNLLIKCIDECQADEKVSVVSSLISSTIPYINNWVNNGQYDNKYEPIRSILSISPYLLKNKQVSRMFIAALKDEKPGVRYCAAYALGKLKVNTLEMVEFLLITLKSDKSIDVRCAVINALGKISIPEALEGLINALNDEDFNVKIVAAGVLGSIKINTSKVVELFLAALKDENPDLRYYGAYALGTIRVNTTETIEALIVALKDENFYVRGAAARALGSIGANTPKVSSNLITALKDKNWQVRDAAAEALGIIRTNTPETIEVLLVTLNNDENLDVRRKAARALGLISANTPEVVKSLVAVLKNDKDSGIRCTAVVALGRINVNTPEVERELLIALNDKCGSVEIAAIYVLKNIELNNHKKLKGLLAALKDKDFYVRRAAAKALGYIEANTHEAVEGLITALKDENEQVRKAAAETLGFIRANTHETVEGLIVALNDENGQVRKAVAETLGYIEVNTSEAVESLIITLKYDKDSNVRKAVARTLGSIRPNTYKVVQDLIIALKNDNDKYVKYSVAEALNKLMKNNDIIETVTTNLKDDNDRINYFSYYLSAGIKIKCYAACGNSTWLNRLSLFSNSLIILDKIQNTIYIKDDGFTGEVKLSLKQLKVLFDALEKQAKDEKLPTDVYEYYKGTGKLGFNSILGVKELTTLHIASQNGDLEMVKTILEKDKSYINDQNNKYKETPLMLAAQNGHWEIAYYLIAQGADINCYNAPKDGDRKNVIEILTNIYEKSGTILTGYQNSKGLLDQRCNASLVVVKGNISKERLDAFKKAIDNDSATETQKLLMINKDDINYYIDSEKNTLLMYAVKNRSSSVVKKLMEFGADAKQTNDKGETAITVCEKAIDKFQNKLNKNNILKILETLIKARSFATGFNRSLEDAITSYPDEAKLNETVNDLVGCKNIEDYLKDERLRDIYRLHLGNIITITREYGSQTRTEGNDSVILLSMRFYLYFKLLVRLHNDQAILMNEMNGLTAGEVVEKLKKECLVILDLLHHERIRASYDINETAAHKKFRDAHAYSIVSQLKTLQANEEISLQSGYQIATTDEAHCLYVSFTKLENNKVLIRIDNRWIKSGRRDGNEHGKAPWVIRGIDNIDKIKPYLVGVISLDNNKLCEYISNVLYAISKTQTSAAKAIDYIYNIPQSMMSYAINSIYNSVFEKPQLVMVHVDKWSYQNRQSDSNANCTMSSHNFGVMVRNGEKCFKWLCNWEKSEIWQDVEVGKASVVNRDRGVLSGALQTQSKTTEKTTVIKQETPKTPKLYSHTELMKKFQKSLSVSWESVYTGIAVEQSLVGQAGIKTTQTSAMFRSKVQTETAFSLKFASNTELNKFTDYYNEKFSGLIKSKDSYNDKRFTTIVLDTQILYEKVAPFLQIQIVLKNNYTVMANIMMPISQVLRQRLSNPLSVRQGNNNYFSWLPQDVIIHILSFLPEASTFHLNTICSLLNKFTAQKIVTAIERKVLLESSEQPGFVERLMQEANTKIYQEIQ